MKLPTRKEAVHYLYDQVLAHFTDFCIGIYSTAIVSRFFETRSITNLWGFLARKTVVDEGPFNILERIVAVVIGFIVFVLFIRAATTSPTPLQEWIRAVSLPQLDMGERNALRLLCTVAPAA